MPRLAAKFTLMLLCLVAALPINAATAERRVALLIGNAKYDAGRLQYPPQDVEVMRAALLKIGFNQSDLVVVVDADRRAMATAIQEFSSRAKGADVALFYYSGHATQAQDSNWLIPIGADIRTEQSYEVDAISAQHALNQLSAARPKIGIMILDACRNNPVSSTKGQTKGLARMPGRADTLIAFATAAGETANDNGLYARMLSSQLLKPGLELLEVFRVTSTEVKKASGGLQVPSIGEITINDHIYLAGPPLSTQSTFAPNPIVRNSVLDDESFETAADGVSLLQEALKREKTLASLQALAERNDPQATYLVGVAKLAGVGTPIDYPGARQYFKRALDLQFRRAQYAYGGMLYDGQGGPEDKRQAIELWEAGAAQRFSPSMIRLGRYYAFESPSRDRNPDKARELFRRASADTPDALALLASMVLEGAGQAPDIKAGIKMMEEAATKGSPSANLRMARFHRWGINAPKNAQTALKYYAKAVELRSVDAMTDAGALLVEGTEVPKDLELGLLYLQQAEKLISATADSLLVKAYLLHPTRMPKDWPIRTKAVTAAEAGQIDGLVRLVGAYRDGTGGMPQDWRAVDSLARTGSALVAKASPDSESAWPLNAYVFGRSRIRAAEDGNIPIPQTELAELKRLWAANASLKRFTVPSICSGKQSPHEIYIWDATGKNAPTDAQFEWIKAARGCTVGNDVIESFQKLYRIAQENNVSFSELSVYALSKANTPTTQQASASSSRTNTDSNQGTISSRAARSLEEAGLAAIIQDIGRYERIKIRASAKLQQGMPEESALERWIEALDSTTSQTDIIQDSCAGVSLLGLDRSKKAGEAAGVFKLDMFCSGNLNAYLLLPDDPKREITLFVRTRKSSTAPGSEFGTRYVLSRTEGVVKSWHDIDGDGKPDSFGFHLGGNAQPTKTLALSTSAL